MFSKRHTQRKHIHVSHATHAHTPQEQHAHTHHAKHATLSILMFHMLIIHIHIMHLCTVEFIVAPILTGRVT